MGSTEQSINEEEVFDRTCGRNVQKKPIYRRGPGDSGMTQVSVERDSKRDGKERDIEINRNNTVAYVFLSIPQWVHFCTGWVSINRD